MAVNFKEISGIIRSHRNRSGLNQAELALLAGVGKTSVFDVESGKSTVQYNTLLKILQALNISVQFDSPLMKELGVGQYESR